MSTHPAGRVHRRRVSLELVVAAAVSLLALFVYLRTLAPSVAFLFDDSLEFQLLASRMAIAHPTGYPLYSLLLKLFTFVPLGDIAYRANLLSASSGALAVGFVYLAARRLTSRFIRPNDSRGEIIAHGPAVVAALIFAFGETFWAQAVVAEVYTLQALLTAVLLWLALRWGEDASVAFGWLTPQTTSHHPSLLPLALWSGLMLAHHRMTVLILPALAIYIVSYHPTILRQPRRLLKLAVVFVLPLLLYLYLPWRGAVTTSLNGLYANTPRAFLDWVLGSSYSVFLTQNPLNQERDILYYWNLLFNEFTPFGIGLAGVGLAALFMRAWREWLLVALALLVNLAFGVSYRVADIDVFFIPAFVFIALLIATALAALVWLAYYILPERAALPAALVGLLALLLLPAGLAHDHYGRVDLSDKWEVHDYGRDILAQPFPPNSTLIGILGEMTLVRYFQETQGLVPELETLPADKEDARLVTIETALDNQRSVFLTRPLSGAEKEYALNSFGPLIRVTGKPNRSTPPAPLHPLDVDWGGVKLIGYDLDGSAASDATTWHASNGRRVRVTLYWHVEQRPKNNRLVSIKLLDAAGRIAGQLDRRPVLDAYPTTAWHNGEYITDTYDVPIFTGAAPGSYTLQATLYDPESGTVYGQRELETVAVSPDTEEVYPARTGVERTPLTDFGGIQLTGYSLDTSGGYPPGALLPLTLVWRVFQPGGTVEYELTVQNASGLIVQTQKGSIEAGALSPGQYVRQETTLTLPANVQAGRYSVRLVARGRTPSLFTVNNLLLGALNVRVAQDPNE